MSRSSRNVLVIVAAIAVAAAAFLLLRPDDDEPAPSPTPATTSPVTATQPAATTPRPTATTDNKPQVFVIRTKAGAPVGEPASVDVEKGDTVRIDVTSDVDEEVHVHGYDISKAVAAGRRARLRFPATIDGRFEIEFHESGEKIGELTVNP